MTQKPRMRSTTPKTRKNDNLEDIITTPHKNLFSTIKLDIKAKNETQKRLANSIKNNYVTICSGPAGGGKAQPLDA